MKKSAIFILPLLIAFICACHNHGHTVIATHTENSDIRLEYSGMMSFSSDGTKVQTISRDGYIDYKRNNEQLHASPDAAGHVQYEVDGTKVMQLDNTGQRLLKEAISMIIKSGH